VPPEGHCTVHCTTLSGSEYLNVNRTEMCELVYDLRITFYWVLTSSARVFDSRLFKITEYFQIQGLLLGFLSPLKRRRY
jgi:hypothetical protein